MSELLEVATEQGPARFHLDGDPAAPLLLVLGHGAGGGVEAPDLAALATQLPGLDERLAVARFEQPWRLAGRKVAPAPARLDEAWLAALPQLLAARSPRRLVVGGRSAGARVACRTGAALRAAATLALSFPLHPPGHPEKSRVEELAGAVRPVLMVQGSRDPFGGGDEVRAALAGQGASVADEPDPTAPVRLLHLVGAAHELTLPKRHQVGTEQAWRELSQQVTAWLAGLLDGDAPE